MVEQLVSISRSTIACRLGHETDASGDNVRGGAGFVGSFNLVCRHAKKHGIERWYDDQGQDGREAQPAKDHTRQ